MSAATNESKINATQTNAQVMSQVSSALANADSTVALGVQSLALVYRARTAQLTRTAASVSARYGASSPQAEAAKAAVTVSQAILSRVALLQKRVSLPTPEAPAEGWVLYGHVYHSTLKPASAYTVFMVDEQNAYQSNIGFAYTGSDGSFHLSYITDKKASEAAVFLQIVNDQAQPVYLSSTAFQPQIGAANYQDIILPAGEPILGDPPPAIRTIAMPNENPNSTTTSQPAGKPALEELPVAKRTRMKRTARTEEK